MKILFFVNSFLPSVGGREIVVYYLAKALIKIGHQVRIFGPLGFRDKRQFPEGIPIHRWPGFHSLSIEKIWYINLFLDTAIWGCDIIHAHATNPSGYIAARMKNIIGCPLIITPHGADIQIIPEINYGERLDPLKNKRILEALKTADQLIAISKGIESSILSTGISHGKISRIPNGVDFERFNKPVYHSVADFLNIEKGSKVIVNVGNHRICKGQEVLVKSMPEILKYEPNAVLVIVGKGTEVLMPLIRSYGLEKHVRLTGPIGLPFLKQNTKKNYAGDDLLASIYAESCVYVSAGIDEGAEGFPLTTLEAMAAGLPVAATAISGNKDVVKDGVNGLLVKPNSSQEIANGVIKLFRDANKQRKMGIYAKETAMNYSWESVAVQYAKVYEQVVQSKRKSVKKVIENIRKNRQKNIYNKKV